MIVTVVEPALLLVVVVVTVGCAANWFTTANILKISSSYDLPPCALVSGDAAEGFAKNRFEE